MKKIVTILFAIIISSCSIIDDEIIVYHVDPELEEYVEIYKEEALKRGKNHNIDKYDVTIKLADGLSETGAWGRCSTRDFGKTKIIRIDREWFETQNYNPKNHYRIEKMVSHECGHCFQDKKHLKEGQYGIMSRMTYDIGMVENRDIYYDQLFK